MSGPSHTLDVGTVVAHSLWHVWSGRRRTTWLVWGWRCQHWPSCSGPVCEAAPLEWGSRPCSAWTSSPAPLCSRPSSPASARAPPRSLSPPSCQRTTRTEPEHIRCASRDQTHGRTSQRRRGWTALAHRQIPGTRKTSQHSYIQKGGPIIFQSWSSNCIFASPVLIHCWLWIWEAGNTVRQQTSLSYFKIADWRIFKHFIEEGIHFLFSRTSWNIHGSINNILRPTKMPCLTRNWNKKDWKYRRATCHE